MSCIESSPVVYVLGGLFLGASLGTQRSVVWAVLGAVLGAVGGLLFYFVVAFCFAIVGWLVDRAQGGNTALFTPKPKRGSKP